MEKIFENKWFLLIVIALTWGSSFILIKKSLLVFTPYEIGAFGMAVSGLILAYIGFPALRKMNNKTLFWVALTGFLGAAVLMCFSEATSEESKLGYALLVVLATACYAVAGLIIKEKLQHVPPVQLSGAVFSVWMIPSLFILFFSGFFSDFETNPEIWEALGYLSILTVVGTAIAMILYYKLIQNTSAVFASTVTYLLPLVAVNGDYWMVKNLASGMYLVDCLSCGE